MATPECALARLDPLLLAWAAGFFDGEGSTIVHASRPGYLRLTASVSQSGGAEPPEVLFRFQCAMLGLGEIVPQNADSMWVWRSRSGEEAQAAIAMLWSQIGAVKQRQAAVAIRRLHAQYGPTLRSRAPRVTRGTHFSHASHADHVVTSREQLEHSWAAGFLDGEGHFGLPRAVRRKNAPDWRRIRVSATQNGLPGQPPEVLHRLVRIFGGKIERHGEPDDFRWLIEGIRNVEGVFVCVRPWLGTVKQKQARSAIEGWRGQIRLHGDASRCARGHAYDRTYMSRTGPQRRCNACARIRGRRQRARMGIPPRPFKSVARRYNS